MANRANSKIEVTLKKSYINTKPEQRLCLKGLGLSRIGQKRTLENIPAVRGMIKKVIHLVAINESV